MRGGKIAIGENLIGGEKAFEAKNESGFTRGGLS